MAKANLGRLPEYLTYHERRRSRAERAVEREVFGVNAGITSYTTPAQADALAEALALGPGTQLLDVGAGAGWPAVFLAERTGCQVMLTDVPVAGLRLARLRAHEAGQSDRCRVALASGARLPFRPRTFDAVVHTDVL